MDGLFQVEQPFSNLNAVGKLIFARRLHSMFPLKTLREMKKWKNIFVASGNFLLWSENNQVLFWLALHRIK